eukprot:3361591-Pleurochrysis_carterae.AAC.2
MFRMPANGFSGRTEGPRLAERWPRGLTQDPRPPRSTEWSMPRQTTHIRSPPHAWIRFTLSESEGKKPRKERPLPASPGLRHAVYRLFNATHSRSAVSADSGVSWGRVAVHYFVVLKVALQVCRNEVPPAAHLHILGVSDGRERAQGSGTHRGAK